MGLSEPVNLNPPAVFKASSEVELSELAPATSILSKPADLSRLASTEEMALELLSCKLPLVNANTFLLAAAPVSLVRRRASFNEIAWRDKSTVTPLVALAIMLMPAASKAMAWSKVAVPEVVMALRSSVARVFLALVQARAVATVELPETRVIPALLIAKACASVKLVESVRVNKVLPVPVKPATVLGLVSKPRPMRLKTSEAVMLVLVVV